MKKSALVITMVLTAVCALAAIGYISGNGNIVSEKRDVKGFSGISASSAAHVVVEKGKDYSCVVSLDSNLLPSFRTAVEHGVLVMGFAPGTFPKRVRKLEIKITMPEIKKIVASGASNVELGQGFAGKELSVDLSGASKLNAAAEYEILGVKASGASKADLSGKYGDIAIDLSGASHMICDGGALGLTGSVSGASTVGFERCALKDADLKVSGASNVRLSDVSSKIKADLSGASELRYEGDAQLDKRLSGASSIKKLR
jgi:hypothetical protein